MNSYISHYADTSLSGLALLLPAPCLIRSGLRGVERADLALVLLEEVGVRFGVPCVHVEGGQRGRDDVVRVAQHLRQRAAHVHVHPILQTDI